MVQQLGDLIWTWAMASAGEEQLSWIAEASISATFGIVSRAVLAKSAIMVDKPWKKWREVQTGCWRRFLEATVSLLYSRTIGQEVIMTIILICAAQPFLCT
jgi:hypothetical protein